jgi:sucrose phosphorylase
VAAHAILVALVGVPALYFHSLFGSKGWREGVLETGRNRSINREKLLRADLERELSNPESLRAHVFHRLAHLLKIRGGQRAFGPYERQRVLEGGHGVFAVLRQATDEGIGVLCIQNVTSGLQPVNWPLTEAGLDSFSSGRDLLHDRSFEFGKSIRLELLPYQTIWLKGENQR